MKSPIALRDSAEDGRFATTRWHLILQDPETADAASSRAETLAHLAHVYWRPISAIIFRRGCSSADAQDLTQGFFLAIAEGKLLQAAAPERGRFRSLLLKALQNFLSDQAVRDAAAKRGGRVQFVSWDQQMDESRLPLKLSVHAIATWPDERIFDAGWAASVAAEALRQLRIDYESAGRRRLFDALSGHLTADRTGISYTALGEELQEPEETVKRLLRQIRVRYRRHLRNEVAATVADAGDVEDELRYLCAALAAAGA